MPERDCSNLEPPEPPPGPGIEVALNGHLGQFKLDLSFNAPLDGVTALLGPSGSGKTTVLRCIAGLARVSGEIRVDGEQWQGESPRVFRAPHRRAVGYVFQESSLFPHLSVRKNLLFGANRPQPERPSDSEPNSGSHLEFEALVTLLGISHLLERKPSKLSGGERQRIAIGRALLSRPRLLLMDEPLSSLDRGTKDEILPYLDALHRTAAMPIVYVSHDVSEVARLADRMIVLSAGQAVAKGSVSEILERLDLQPETGRFEAGVLLSARVLDHDPTYRVTRLWHNGQILTVPVADLPPGLEVRLRIRARDVALAIERPKGISMRNVLSGTVYEVREEANTAFAETLVDVGGARLRARITRAAVADLDLRAGRPVYALIKSVSFDRRSLVLPPSAPSDPLPGVG